MLNQCHFKFILNIANLLIEMRINRKSDWRFPLHCLLQSGSNINVNIADTPVHSAQISILIFSIIIYIKMYFTVFTVF